MKISLAGCVLLDDYGRILLLHRSADAYSHWEIPGGKLEQDETAEAAAVRESKEELGVDVRIIKSLGTVEFEDDENHYTCTLFEAVATGGQPRICEPNLFDDLDYFEPEDMMSLSLSPAALGLLPKIVSGEVAFDS